jgi:mitochondrial import inner membrane translocase subunit TIM44
MLPRHLRPLRLRPTTASLQALSTASPTQFRLGLTRASNLASRARSFHSSRPRFNELPKSPFQTFVDVLKDELKKNRELSENVKQLQGDVDKLQDSEALKRAKDMYERARVGFIYFCSR